MAEEKNSRTWIDVKASLPAFDRAGLLGLIQDLYCASKGNEAFLHARLGLGRSQPEPYKIRISKSICPDKLRNEPVWFSKAISLRRNTPNLCYPQAGGPITPSGWGKQPRRQFGGQSHFDPQRTGRIRDC